MLEIKKYRFYFCPCTQDLYGDEVLKHVAEHSAEVVAALNASDKVPFEVVLKPNLLTSDVIQATFNEANMDPECAGIITWAHTFSPSKNYIAGLRDLRKPLCQFATQYNEEIPYDTIDMDFMNENQAAHGERELGHIFARMRWEHKVVFGYWQDEAVLAELGHDAPSVGDHALGVAGDDLRVELHVGPDDVADLAQDLEGLATGLGEDGRVGGHAVHGIVLDQALDGVDVGVVDDELHGCFLSLCRMRQRDSVPSYPTGSARCGR